MSYQNPSSRRRRQPHKGRHQTPQPIGNADETVYTFDQVAGGNRERLSGGAIAGFVIVGLAILAVIVMLIVIVAVYNRDSDTLPPTVPTTSTTTASTSSTMPSTSTTTPEPTTQPPLGGPVEIICPPDVNTTLGKPFDPSVTGTPNVSGGCTIPNVTWVDDEVDAIARRGAFGTPAHIFDAHNTNERIRDTNASHDRVWHTTACTAQIMHGQVGHGLHHAPLRSAVARDMSHHVVMRERVRGQTRNNIHAARRQEVNPRRGANDKTDTSLRQYLRQQHARDAPDPTASKIIQTHSTMISDSGVLPPDPVMDVGTTHVIAAYNAPVGAVIQVYSKTLGAPLLVMPMSDIAVSGPCTSGGGDPDILYDHHASRWLLMELANGDDVVCLYVSDGPNPLTATFMAYSFTFDFFPDYPKLGLMNDYYTMTYNSGTSPVQQSIIERPPLIAGALTTRILTFGSPLPNLPGFGFQTFTPVTVDAGPQPNASIPGVIYMRHHDDELHSAPGTVGTDLIDVIQCMDIDFDGATANCTGYQIAIGEFNSFNSACPSNDACIETPGDVLLDPLREVLMHRLVFRNLPTCNDAQRIYGTLTTDANGIANSKVVWLEFEYNHASGLFGIRQEGVISPDLNSRWMPSMSADTYGNALAIYSVSSKDKSPSLFASARLQDDTLGIMRDEVEWAAGSTWVDPLGGGANRWGDYFAVSADPEQGYTFFGIGQYAGPAATWRLRLTRFILDGTRIDRVWTAQDTCNSTAVCTQRIQLGHVS